MNGVIVEEEGARKKRKKKTREQQNIKKKVISIRRSKSSRPGTKEVLFLRDTRGKEGSGLEENLKTTHEDEQGVKVKTEAEKK